MSATTKQRDTLYERLGAGYARIESALGEGRDIAAWEDLWLALLDEYEAVCARLVGECDTTPTGAAAAGVGA